MIPRQNVSQKFRKLKENFVSGYKIRLPEVEKLSVPTKHRVFSQMSTEPETISVKEQLDQWLRRSSSQPKDRFDHSKHKYFQKTLISNDNLCSGSAVDILAYIQSSPENYARRQAIRESWGNGAAFLDINFKLVFVVGKSTNKESEHKIKASINYESIQYKDILLLDVVDTFKNITLKSISALHWIYNICSQAKYILKADDDIYVNVFLLIEYFMPQVWNKEKAIICHYKTKGTSPIVRASTNKWYIPKNIFEGEKYFPFGFCTGYAILFTSNLLPEMYKASLKAPYIGIDDVYAFGLLLKDIKNITVISAQSNFTLNQNAALSEYEGSQPISHIVASAWAQKSMNRYWYATIRKLSKWGKLHCRLSTL